MVKTLTPEFAVSGPTRSLSGWVTERLRQAILNGHFEPGDRLDQDAIAAELEVSRTPLREAIAALETEGLLESSPYQGVFVTSVSKKDIHEVFAVRALLEAEVVRQATSAIPDAVVDELQAMLQEAQKAYNNGDEAAQFEADRRFHETLRAFSGNTLLADVLDGIDNRISFVRRFAQMRPGPHVDEFAQEHFGVLHAIRERDSDQATELMMAHLQKSSRRVQELAPV